MPRFVGALLLMRTAQAQKIALQPQASITNAATQSRSFGTIAAQRQTCSIMAALLGTKNIICFLKVL
jgi:hypothetical protein